MRTGSLRAGKGSPLSPGDQRVHIGIEVLISTLALGLPIGSIVVPFCGLDLGSYKVIPKRNYYGACG